MTLMSVPVPSDVMVIVASLLEHQKNVNGLKMATNTVIGSLTAIACFGYKP